MIAMNNWPTEAVQKITAEKKAVTGQKEKAMAEDVFATIRDFCLQDAEFAQAVAQGGSFADCMKAVAKGVGNSISDIEAYRKAVQFYFPGAKVQMQLSIRLSGEDKDKPKHSAEEQHPEKPAGIVLSLDDYLF